MKSKGLALTIFVLIGALAALDLSGASVAHSSISRNAPVASVSNTIRQAASAEAKTDKADLEDADEEDGETVNTFLLSPWPVAPAIDGPVAALRYD